MKFFLSNAWKEQFDYWKIIFDYIIKWYGDFIKIILKIQEGLKFKKS